MRIYGGMQQGGNLGQVTDGNLTGTPSFQIGPRSPFKGMSQEELNKLKEWDSRPGELQKYYEQQNRPGPSLPFADLPGAAGNMGGLLLAQLPPAGGNADAGFVPSFQNPVVIPEGFEQQLNQMEKDIRQRPTPSYRYSSMGIGNVGGLEIAQREPWQEILMRAPGSMTDVPPWDRAIRGTIREPYNPNKYPGNSKKNPLRQLPDPRMEGFMGPGIVPYFNQYGPQQYGTGAV